MENNNIPNENKENLSALELLENIISLSCAAHEQEINKAKEGLERCVNPDAECAGCPYAGKADGLLRCFDKLMEDALRLIGALEMENKILATVIAKNNMQLMEALNEEDA